MKKIISYGVLLLILTAAGFGFILRPSARDGKDLYRYGIKSPATNPVAVRELLRWLSQNDFDISGTDWKGGTVEVITDNKGLKTLQERGLTGTIRQRVSPGRGASSLDPNYLNPQKVEDGLRALARQYSDRTRLEQIGSSIEGRPIWALLISSTPEKGDPRLLEKPSIIFDGLHHAREVMTAEVVLDVAQTLLQSTRVRSAMSDILERWNVWVVPMLNVDGSNRVWTADAWWRKNTHGTNSKFSA